MIQKPGVEIMAIVKAEAYGHGMERVASALSEGGVSFFGVAHIDEAVKLRQTRKSAQILVLGAAHFSQWPVFLRERVIPTLSCLEDARSLNSFLKKKNKTLPVHLKVDTGMGRMGVGLHEAEDFFSDVTKLTYLKVEGLYTHFSSADDKHREPTLRQIRLFEKMVLQARSLGIEPRYLHAANSMGTLRFKEASFNLVRPGIILYGLKPSANAVLPKGIGPVLSWKTRISLIKKMKAGTTLSYGRTFKVKRSTHVAVLPVGYSHGFRVGLSNRARVLIGGRSYPVAGRVTMDQILVDLGPKNRARRWDEAVLIGRQGALTLTAERMAAELGTIPYEIVCAIHPRVPKTYLS